MQLKSNGFKSALADGTYQTGLWLGLTDTISAEICACAGFDWLCVDAEHGPNTLRTVLRQLQVLAAYPAHVIVRPVSDDPALLKQYLDLGAQNLLLPMIQSKHQAERAVAAVNYPPEGIRGVGTALARASRWNLAEKYLNNANQNICLIVQIEDRNGLRNLPDILTVPGIHGAFIGPADLAASLGHLGNPGHADVKSAVENAIKLIADSDKAAGVMTSDSDLAAHYRQCGACFVGVGADTVLLAQAAKSLAEKARS